MIQPPEDQRGCARLVVLYFVKPDDDTKLVPLADSPLLQRMTIRRRFEDHEAPTMEIWTRIKASAATRAGLLANPDDIIGSSVRAWLSERACDHEHELSTP